jgi:hypothetical protein
MAIYETCIPEHSSLSNSSSAVLKAVMAFLWAGPKHLLLSKSALLLFPTYHQRQSDDLYARGLSEPRGFASFKSTLYAGMSMSVWCMGFIAIAAVAATSKSTMNRGDTPPAPAPSDALRIVHRTVIWVRVLHSFWRRLLLRAFHAIRASRSALTNEESKEIRRSHLPEKIITHSGTCHCGCVQFHVRIIDKGRCWKEIERPELESNARVSLLVFKVSCSSYTNRCGRPNRPKRDKHDSIPQNTNRCEFVRAAKKE